MPVQIAPSILAADFAHLADHIARVGDEADRLHVDCMDGHYVPNLSIGPPVVQSLRAATPLYLDCHLMIANPGDLLDAFAAAGANGITVHVEVGDTDSLLGRIRDLGCKVGITLEPDTPFDKVEPWLDRVDTLLVMSVHTGFGGQAFIPEVLDKVRAGRAVIDERGLPVDIEIDGGINVQTARRAAEAGAHILVAGTAIFHQPDPRAAAAAIRAAAHAASRA
ncbi:MAG TPA: ribulose-phosphate 3-epimerase [Acidimicrobiia bacterium]|jgi:ribulose-phosphate 3-epimerase